MTKTKSDLLADFRQAAASQPATKTAQDIDNTKSPLTELDQAALRAHIASSAAPWLLAFYDLSLATGWRTNDVCSMRFSDIDFKEGTAGIIVAKQTKQAQARALTKSIEAVRTAQKAAAVAAGDAVAYMLLDNATHDQIVAGMTAEQKEQAFAAVSKAKVKTDNKALPSHLLQLLAAMQQERGAQANDYIFSRALSCSRNGTDKTDGHLSRVTIYTHMKKAIAAVAEKLETAAKKLSAYSLRKSFAINLLAVAGSIEIVMAAFGHSSTAITQRYLNLNDSVKKYQLEMINAHQIN
ncbi:MAG: tyrosine-type recombinase/integrase [Vibrionaceae bacterium]